MFAFFYSLYLAIFNGSWVLYSEAEARSALASAWNDVSSWVMNALGGHFQTIQSFTWTASTDSIWSLILAMITISGVCFAVWRLVKGIFNVFFQGWR